MVLGSKVGRYEAHVVEDSDYASIKVVKSSCRQTSKVQLFNVIYIG